MLGTGEVKCQYILKSNRLRLESAFPLIRIGLLLFSGTDDQAVLKGAEAQFVVQASSACIIYTSPHDLEFVWKVRATTHLVCTFSAFGNAKVSIVYTVQYFFSHGVWNKNFVSP